ncbi:MAG: S-ribosylhomocysteine lyase [Eubacterium sp.]|nr:S-ribosylhomocysteine lyase [Eubacterium sp.]
MKLTPSSDIDYNILKKGIFLSKIDDDITTYDIRMKEPNRETVLTNSAIHTIEHIFKTYVQNTEFADNIIFFGPMGSRTGFYFITKRLSDNYSIQLIKDAFTHISEFWGRIPGASPNECGNCLEHNLPQAKEEAKEFLEVIRDWTKEDLEYPKNEE